MEAAKRPPAVVPACIAREGFRYSSTNRIHQRIFHWPYGSSGVSFGPSNTSSMYSMAGVDSNILKPSWITVGMVPCGLIAT